MKKHHILLGAFFAIVAVAISSFKLVNKPKPANCMMAVTYSEMAMIQFKKASKAKSLDDAKPFIKKGMEQIHEASAYAVQCDCTESEAQALNAYNIAKRLYDKGTDLDKMKPEIKLAMTTSINAMSAAQKCNK